MANKEVISDLQIVHVNNPSDKQIVFDEEPSLVISNFVEVFLNPH